MNNNIDCFYFYVNKSKWTKYNQRCIVSTKCLLVKEKASVNFQGMN